jgi:hypothetical protein
MEYVLMRRLKSRWSNWRISSDRRTRVILGAFVLLALEPFVVAAVQAVFVSPKHVATGQHSSVVISLASWVVLLISLIGLFYGRRWAWVILMLLYVPGVIVDLVNLKSLIVCVIAVARIVLLISPPMLRHVGLTKTAVGNSG